MRVLVAGATGGTGHRLVQELIDKGHDPIAMVRESSDTSDLPQGVEIRQADLTNLPDNVLDDVDAVVFAAGSGSGTGTDQTKAVDRDGAKSLIDLAAKKGIQKFVMLSSIGADQPDQGAEKMQPYLQAKHEADEHLKSTDLSWAIIRPVSLTDDDGNRHVEMALSVDPSKQVARGDVAAVLAIALTEPALTGRVVEMASA